MPLIAMILSSAAITLGVAALSWTLIEKRALALKGDFAAATSRAVNLGWAKIGGVVRRAAAPEFQGDSKLSQIRRSRPESQPNLAKE